MALVRRARDVDDDFFPGFADAVEVGVGRFATVFAAREVATERVVALKLLTARAATPAAAESFARESAALGVLGSHPNVVTLFRSFAAADGRPVLALELCRESVVVRGQRLPVPEAIETAARIGRALEAAHAAGVVHCDVKPASILRSEYAEPLLADFGAAVVPSRRRAGLVDAESPHVAPELAAGEPPTPAVDVYGLASTLYELLAGRPAFGPRLGRPLPAVSRGVDVAPALANSEVPAALSALIVRAMSAEPAARPTTAEFAATVTAVAADPELPPAPAAAIAPEPIDTSPVATPRRTVRIDDVDWDDEFGDVPNRRGAPDSG